MGKVAIVTGGGDGIGYGIATSLAQEGYDLALWDVRAEVGQAAAKKLAAEHGVRTLAVTTDVAKADQVEAATKATVEGLGTPYLLVNNAGITRIGRMEDVKLADWQAVIDVNLTGVFLCTQAVGRHMLAAREGVIVNIASVSALTPQVYRPAYGGCLRGARDVRRAPPAGATQAHCRCNRDGHGDRVPGFAGGILCERDQPRRRRWAAPDDAGPDADHGPGRCRGTAGRDVHGAYQGSPGRFSGRDGHSIEVDGVPEQNLAGLALVDRIVAVPGEDEGSAACGLGERARMPRRDEVVMLAVDE